MNTIKIRREILQRVVGTAKQMLTIVAFLAGFTVFLAAMSVFTLI